MATIQITIFALKMDKPDQRIIKLIKQHHVLTLATCTANIPWCASCFYVWWNEATAFVFTSDETTKHGKEALENNHVAANIYLETKIVGKIRGVQISGKIFQPGEDMLKNARNRYFKKFPYAKLLETTMWILAPEVLKMTDNRFGFGKKMIWKKDEGSKIY